MMPVLVEAAHPCAGDIGLRRQGYGRLDPPGRDPPCWTPGAVNIVAAIKVVRHNLYRCTSLFHETGHQVSHLTSWTASMRASIERTLADDAQLRAMWGPWSSEIAADVFAFPTYRLRVRVRTLRRRGRQPDDSALACGRPHPIGWLLRTLLGCAFSRRAFGASPPSLWDALEEAMLASHPPTHAHPPPSFHSWSDRGHDCRRSQQHAWRRRSRAGRTSHDAKCAGPGARLPAALSELERSAGPALWTSQHWRNVEGIRIVALAGLREAERPETASVWIDRARTWMTSDSRAA